MAVLEENRIGQLTPDMEEFRGMVKAVLERNMDRYRLVKYRIDQNHCLNTRLSKSITVFQCNKCSALHDLYKVVFLNDLSPIFQF